MEDSSDYDQKKSFQNDLNEIRKLSSQLEANPNSRDAYVNLIKKMKSMGPFMADELQTTRTTMAEKMMLTEGT